MSATPPRIDDALRKQALPFEAINCHIGGMSLYEDRVEVLDRLKIAGLRPTRQRQALASLLFGSDDRHVTAEQLHGEAQNASIKVSLATIYNALHQFTDAGLLREVVVEPGRSYFDTNVDDHHHFYIEETGQLIDIPTDTVQLSCLPVPPLGTVVSRVDVIIRIRSFA
jgi:Fur family transcriptional regulator, iron response regulator